MKNVYFLSDAHLGSRAIDTDEPRTEAGQLSWTASKHKASAVYLLATCSTSFEFRTVVPKGYTRFLGKLSELTDLG